MEMLSNDLQPYGTRLNVPRRHRSSNRLSFYRPGWNLLLPADRLLHGGHVADVHRLLRSGGRGLDLRRRPFGRKRGRHDRLAAQPLRPGRYPFYRVFFLLW